MLLNRFFCGALGTSSATIRETAVQSYLPSDMRARVNAIFNIIFAVGGDILSIFGWGTWANVILSDSIIVIRKYRFCCNDYVNRNTKKEN